MKTLGFVNFKPTCASCGCEIVIVNVCIDFQNCEYIISCDCIKCGSQADFKLDLEGFIDINRQSLGIGGLNEQKEG